MEDLELGDRKFEIVEEVEEEEELEEHDSETELVHSGINPSVPRNGRYPFCIVWSPIPLATWLFPPIGHVGICDSEGFTYDFSGPYQITEDNMLFGRPAKYIFVKDINKKTWDRCVQSGNDSYRNRFYNPICTNCHHHVVHILNDMKFEGHRNHNIVSLAFKMFFQGKFIDKKSIAKTFLPIFGTYMLIIGVVHIMAIYYFFSNTI